jgi:Caspase domain
MLQAEADSKEQVKQLLAAVEEQKIKALVARQEAEKMAQLSSNEVSERQKDRELLLQLSAELAKLKSEQQKNSPKVAATQNETLTGKFEQEKSQLIFANRKALVVGNDGYKFVPKLLNAKEDAYAIAENLTKVGYKVTLKLDQSEKEMKASLRNFKAQVEAGDEVAFFYAGHGVQLANTNYLLPVDVAGEGEEQVKDEAISLQRVLDDMSDKKVKFTLAIIDACRDARHY